MSSSDVASGESADCADELQRRVLPHDTTTALPLGATQGMRLRHCARRRRLAQIRPTPRTQFDIYKSEAPPNEDTEAHAYPYDYAHCYARIRLCCRRQCRRTSRASDSLTPSVPNKQRLRLERAARPTDVCLLGFVRELIRSRARPRLGVAAGMRPKRRGLAVIHARETRGKMLQPRL